MEISHRILLDDKSAARSQTSVNADGQKVSRYLLHLYLEHFLSLSLFHGVTVSSDDDSRFTSLQT